MIPLLATRCVIPDMFKFFQADVKNVIAQQMRGVVVESIVICIENALNVMNIVIVLPVYVLVGLMVEGAMGHVVPPRSGFVGGNVVLSVKDVLMENVVHVLAVVHLKRVVLTLVDIGVAVLVYVIHLNQVRKHDVRVMVENGKDNLVVMMKIALIRVKLMVMV